MSLWSHGNDREVYRAQHLFCYGAEEQLAYLAPAPSPEKDTSRLELAGSCDDLLRGLTFANNRIAGDVLSAGPHSPWFQGFDGEVDGGRRVIVGHADRVGGDAGSSTEDVKEDDSCFRLACLQKRKGDQPVQVVEVCRDEDDGGTRPPAWSRVRHENHLYARGSHQRTR